MHRERFYTLNSLFNRIAQNNIPTILFFLRVFNYGHLGSILGHELTHGFDNTGRLFDEGGNVFDWWTNKTIEEYENRTKCLVDYYEKTYQVNTPEKQKPPK